MAAKSVPQYCGQGKGIFAEPDKADGTTAQTGTQYGYGRVPHNAEADDTGAGQGKRNPQLAETKGIFKGKERKALETQIQQREEKISAMLETIPDILKDDGYPDVQAFMATYCKAEVIVNNYNRELAEWERKVKEKSRPAEKERYAPPEKQSVRDQLRRLQAEGRQTKPKHRSHDRER